LQTFTVTNDPRDTEAARAAALATGAQVPDSEGSITVTTTITDLGERKTMFGYPARHMKASIVEESSPKACSQVHEKYELDGWYADIAKEQAGCAHFVPPVHQGDTCHDPVIFEAHRKRQARLSDYRDHHHAQRRRQRDYRHDPDRRTHQTRESAG